MTESHLASFRECLVVVARERKYLMLLEAPPLHEVIAFTTPHIKAGHPQFVAMDGLEKIELHVYASNRNAHRFGFEEEGRLRRKGKVDGVYDDQILMGLFLQDVNGLSS